MGVRILESRKRVARVAALIGLLLIVGSITYGAFKNLGPIAGVFTIGAFLLACGVWTLLEDF